MANRVCLQRCGIVELRVGSADVEAVAASVAGIWQCTRDGQVRWAEAQGGQHRWGHRAAAETSRDNICVERGHVIRTIYAC